MKKLIPMSRFKKSKDNSDSLKARRQGIKDRRDLREGMELLTRAENAWMALDDVRKKQERNTRYVFGDQWSDWVMDDSGKPVKESTRVSRRTGGVALQNNHLIKIIHALTGLYAKQNTEPVCFSKQPNHDEAADMMTDALQTSWQRNQESDLLTTWCEEMLVGGLAVDIEKWCAVNGEEDVYSFPIEPGHFFFESAGIDPRHWDLSLIGHFEDYDKGGLYKEFANSVYDSKQLDYIYEPYVHASALNEYGQQTDKLKGPSWDITERDRYRVYHIWTKEHKMRYRVKDYMDMEQPLYRIELDQLKYLQAENEARLQQAISAGMAVEDIPLITWGSDEECSNGEPIFDTYWHYQAVAPGGYILEEYDCPYEHKEHPYVFKAFEYVHGDIVPFISSVIDQQRYINRLITLFDLVIQASAKGITMIPKSCVPKNMSEKEFARSIQEIGGFLFYDDKGGKSVNKPEVVTSNTNMTGITDMLSIQLGFIPEITSVSDSLQGKTPGNNVAASRYAMETQNSTTSVTPFLNKFGAFELEVAKKKMKMIHQYYKDGTNISNTRTNGYATYYAYNRMTVQDIDFFVRILMSPDSPTMRTAFAEVASELWQAGAIDAATRIQASGIPASSPIYKQLMAAQEAMAAQAQAIQAQQAQGGGKSTSAASPATENPLNQVDPAAMQEGRPYMRGDVDSQTSM